VDGHISIVFFYQTTIYFVCGADLTSDVTVMAAIIKILLLSNKWKTMLTCGLHQMTYYQAYMKLNDNGSNLPVSMATIVAILKILLHSFEWIVT
jgi:hypothetical protein